MFKSPWKLVSILALTIVAAVVLAACGGAAGTTGNKPVDVQITLSEFKIESSLTTFSTGTPYHFVIKNAGAVAHEWAIMPPGATDTSQALIQLGQNELSPGATVTRDFTFTQPGDFEFACHLSGHYEAGMKLPIVVK